MVESGKEYVLQWTGHAAHVTERFAGLLARQALVDVTLICQGQKLRVHKLVLASCSLYFEEMLEQDLGQEPIILLRDLDFEVLKAMVEFMYCGETTISHCYLETLSDAAHVFKVKELECIVKSMLETENTTENGLSETDDSEGVISSSSDRKRLKTRPNRHRYQDSTISSDFEDDLTSETRNDQTLETIGTIRYSEDDANHSLYESMEFPIEVSPSRSKTNERSPKKIPKSFINADGDDEIITKVENEESPFDQKIPNPIERTNEESTTVDDLTDDDPKVSKFSEISTIDDAKDSSSEIFDDRDVAIGVGECSKVYTHKKRRYADSDDCGRENYSDCATESSGIDDNREIDRREISRSPNGSEKRLKVYTRKRRKPSVEKKNSSSSEICDLVKNENNESSINLSNVVENENSSSTLISTCDMETSEYVWSLNSEMVDRAIVASMIEPNVAMTIKHADFHNRETIVNPETEKSPKNLDAKFSIDDENSEIVETPVLRRSVRINQLENDDSLNNNASGALNISKTREKNSYPKIDDYSRDNPTVGRTKRRTNKYSDSRISDENNATTTVARSCFRRNENNDNSRSLRSASKIASEKSVAKTRCSLPKNDGTEMKSRNNVGTKRVDDESWNVLSSTRLNTIASVDRALWGDMSDVLENRDFAGMKMVENRSPSKEIPFALGLLPLRAALERMQATIDHQPRKTRSSVAPLRHETNGGKRREGESATISGKKNVGCDNDGVSEPSTVFHIRIRASSESVDDRRNVAGSEEIVAIRSNSESNGR